MDVPAPGTAAKNIYHGTASFGIDRIRLLVKGQYVAFCAAACISPGANINNKIDGPVFWKCGGCSEGSGGQAR